MRLAPFAAATVLGIMPATFAFAFVGSGLDSVIVAQEASRAACLSSGRSDCPLVFHTADALTPQLLAALAALGVLALVPVLVKRWRARDTGGIVSRTSSAGLARRSEDPDPGDRCRWWWLRRKPIDFERPACCPLGPERVLFSPETRG